MGGGTINICYVKQMDYLDEIISPKNQKLPYFLKWLIYSYKKICKLFTIKQVEDKKVIIIPTNTTNKLMNKWIKYLSNVLYNNNLDTLVLSNTLKSVQGIKEGLSKENINILEGKILKENLVVKIVEYIANEMNENVNNLEVTLLVNENKKIYIESILALAERTRNIKLVTNNVDDFKSLEQKMQELFGILIRVTNNKRKSLEKSRLIINLDFPEELVNKYAINPDAIIVNISNQISIRAKKFSGINVHDMKLLIPNGYNSEFEKNSIYNDFNSNEIYEASIMNMNFDEVQKRLVKDKVFISSLIGVNGVINKKEFEEKCENYVKSIDKMSRLN